MQRTLKWFAVSAAVLVLLAGAAAGVAYRLLKNTVAPAAGKAAIAGLAASAEVVRDGEGVPHIFAGSRDDLYAALGFVHAQDRLWQMELLRLTGQGRLSEVFGERTFTHGYLSAHARSGRPRRAISRGPAPGCAQRARSLRARCQCVPHAQHRVVRAAAAARVLVAAPCSRAVEAGRQCAAAEDDGAAALRQPQSGNGAPVVRGTGVAFCRDRRSHAARPRRPCAPVARACRSLSAAAPGSAAQTGGAGRGRSIGDRCVQQLGGVWRPHAIGQTAAGQ